MPTGTSGDNEAASAVSCGDLNAVPEVQRVFAAPHPPRGLARLKLGTELVWLGTTQLSGTGGEIHRLHPRDTCWSASRKKRSAFTTFLREEIGVELQKRG